MPQLTRWALQHLSERLHHRLTQRLLRHGLDRLLDARAQHDLRRLPKLRHLRRALERRADVRQRVVRQRALR